VSPYCTCVQRDAEIFDQIADLGKSRKGNLGQLEAEEGMRRQ
jgi:hypothetical protein